MSQYLLEMTDLVTQKKKIVLSKAIVKYFYERPIHYFLNRSSWAFHLTYFTLQYTKTML